MKHDRAGPLLSLLLIPIAAGLAFSAWKLPSQPYTGMVLRGPEVVEVAADGPADRAGILPGDVIRKRDPAGGGSPANPVASARPGVAIPLERERAGRVTAAWLVPRAQPAVERRMMAALLVVASGFVLIASLVWSERRDAMTRAFVLLCAAFAWLLAPLPRGLSTVAATTVDVLYTAVTLVLPALCIHFFALFPDPDRVGGRRRVLIPAGYALAGALFAGSLLAWLPGIDPASVHGLTRAIEAVAALWFAGGLLIAVGLFIAAYLGSRSPDVRRRLRVVVTGTILGAAPLAAMSLIRNLSPTTAVPFERLAVLFTLLVPASFAWAIAVHRLFDIAIALRVAAAAALLALGGVVAYASSEWLGTRAGAGWMAQGSGLVLAALAIGAALAGPISARWRGLHPALPRVPEPDGLAAWSAGTSDVRATLEEACRTLCDSLRLDGCAAIGVEHQNAVEFVERGATRAIAPWSRQLHLVMSPRAGVMPIGELAVAPDARAALERGGVRWLVGVGEPVRAVLLLGRRLSGSWLGRLEAREVERFSRHLDVALENAALRRDASSRGALDRELRVAGEVQAHRLPRRTPAYPTLDCAAAALSSESVGGDYYDFVETAPRDFTLAVGDAAGKGVPAALVLAGVQARFRTEAGRAQSPGSVLTALNRELVDFDQPDRFMALLCARVDVRAARLRLANAGLTRPLIRRANGSVEEVPVEGLLLGVSATARYSEVELELQSGEMAVLFTDGLTEARRGDAMFGVEGVRRVLDDCAGRRATDVLDLLMREVRDYADGALDDITVVVLRQLTEPARGPVGPSHFALKRDPDPAESMG